MLELVLGELAALAVLALVFIVGHAAGPWRRTPAGRQLMAMAVVVLALAVSLFLLGADLAPPLVVFALILGAMDVMMAGWLLLLWRARRAHEREERP